MPWAAASPEADPGEALPACNWDPPARGPVATKPPGWVEVRGKVPPWVTALPVAEDDSTVPAC